MHGQPYTLKVLNRQCTNSLKTSGEIQGFVTTQTGTVRLPGAEVIVKDDSDRQVAQVACGEDGRFSVPNLPPGRYHVSASLAEFETAQADAVVTVGKTTDLSLDLPICGQVSSESVDVVRRLSSPVTTGGTISTTDSIGGKEIDQFAPSGGLQASLRLLASIIEVPAGVSIKGGRPSQAGVQLGPGTLADPSTGLTQVSLPDDAIDSVAVLANPYEVEYGRFSSRLRGQFRPDARVTSGRSGSTTSTPHSAPTGATRSTCSAWDGGRPGSRRAAR